MNDSEKVKLKKLDQEKSQKINKQIVKTTCAICRKPVVGEMPAPI